MYRKYQNSAKSSRNERLAQLSEQENVIEKKKREILAKLEAQKRKENEALGKFEPPNITLNVDDKNNSQPFSQHSFTGKKDVEEVEAKVACHRNAFSNDGSFLDQFKKLSSGLNQKNANLLTLPKITRISKDSGGDETSKTQEEKNRGICNNYARKEFDLNKEKEILSKRIQNSNIGDQVLPQQQVQLIPGHQDQVPVTQSGRSNSQILKFTTADAQSDTISLKYTSETMNTNPTTYQLSVNASRDVSLSPLRIPNISQDTLPATSLQNHPHSTRRTCQPEEADDQCTDEEFSFLNKNENKIVDIDTKRKLSTSEEAETQLQNDQMSRITSPSSNEFSRVSPALTDNEEENKDKEHLRVVLGEEKGGGNSSVQNADSSGSSVETVEAEDASNKTADDMLVEEKGNQKKRKERSSENDSAESDNNSKDSYHFATKQSYDSEEGKDKNVGGSDGYQADCDDETYSKNLDQRQKKLNSLLQKSSTHDFESTCKEELESPDGCRNLGGEEDSSSRERRKRKRKSRWGDEVVQGNSANTATNSNVRLPSSILTVSCGAGGKTPMLSKLTRSDPGLIQYARQTFGSTNLSEEDWKKAEDHYKINLLYQDMVKKRAEIDRLEKAGKFKYEYDSDEDVEGGTWEHKLRQQEMMATQLWAEELTRQAAGKHHIGDFLPPEELERFMEKYNAVKQGRNPDLSDYKEFKLKEDNVGYRLLQKMGWNEGQGLGQDGTGITNPVNKASTRHENQGLGVDRPDGLQAGDDEYDAYRKRMMLAYRFRPNPLNNPRRPYY